MEDMNYLKKEIYDLVKTDDLIFEFLQDGALDGIWYWDLDNMENEWMSRRFWELLGYNPDEKTHHSSEWKDIINQDDLKLATLNFQKHLENPTYPYDQIVRYTHIEGFTVWVRCRGVAIYGIDGIAKRMLGAHTDVTEFMNKQQELVTKESEVKALQKNLTILEHKYIKQAHQLEYLEEYVRDLNIYEENSNILLYPTFEEKVNKLFEIAKRLNTNINVIGISIKNHKYIRANFSKHELFSKRISLSEIFSESFKDSLITYFNEQFFIIIDIGYTDTEIKEKIGEITRTINSNKWSIVTPEINILDICKKYEKNCLDKSIVELRENLSY